MNPTNDPTKPQADASVHAFCARLTEAFESDELHSAVLSKYRGTVPDLRRVDLRRVMVRGAPMLQWVAHHTTRDLTHNLTLHDGVARVAEHLARDGFRNAHLHTSAGEYELSITERGKFFLRNAPTKGVPEHAGSASSMPPAKSDQHNREKQRMITLDRPFLRALGVTSNQGSPTLVPAMARKWKQINRFLEVMASAIASSPTLASAEALHVVDFGSGKGYLTFALHDWLTHAQDRQATVTGVDMRADMVALGNGVATELGLKGLSMVQGDVTGFDLQALGHTTNVVVALHACDTATDHAIELGVRAGAELIVCSPCCHKELRPQLLGPHPLRPILQHGVHQAQAAEMLTDGLRAMLLEAAGYDTQVFEFIALEHTNKNKMILAVKRAVARAPTAMLEQVAEVKSFYGIREQRLEQLLRSRWASAPPPPASP